MAQGRHTALDVRRHLDRALHGRARQPRRLDGDPGDPRRPRRVARGARVDGQRLHAHLRRASCSPAPRSATASAGGGCSSIGLGIFTAASAAAALAPTHRVADRRPGRAGHRRRDRHAADADDPQRRRSRPSGAASRSAPGRGSRASRSRWARSSAAPSSRASRGSGSSGSTSRSGSCCCRSRSRLRESYGPRHRLDLPGPRRSSASACSALVWGSCNGNGDGWTSPQIVGRARRRRRPARRLRRAGSSARPSRCCRCASSATAAFAAANVASLLMYFGMFGSIFLLTQFFQTAQGYSPLEAGPAHAPVDGACRWSSRRSRARSPTGSAAGR